MSEQEYRELHPGEIIQPGDEFCVSIGQNRWQPYPTRRDGSLVSASSLARRPIRKTYQTAYEEVPGSRTTQETVIDPQRERIAYEELRPGTEVQPGDQYRNTQGRWVEYTMDTSGVPIVGPTAMARRPYRVNAIIIDALADAHAATAQLQNERDEARAAIAQVKAEFNSQADVLAEVRADEKRLFDDLELLRSEYAKLQRERDELRAEMDTVKGDRMNLREALAAEQRAHKCTMTSGLEACKERDEALAELAQARERIQDLLKTIAENTDQFAEHTATLVRERDEARAKSDRLQGLIDDLLDEPTAKQVQDMLRTWATELDWSGCCFDSAGRDKVSAVQRVLVAAIERIEGMIHPEGGTDDN